MRVHEILAKRKCSERWGPRHWDESRIAGIVQALLARAPVGASTARGRPRPRSEQPFASGCPQGEARFARTLQPLNLQSSTLPASIAAAHWFLSFCPLIILSSVIRHPSSVIRHPSSVIRHPSFVIRHSGFVISGIRVYQCNPWLKSVEVGTPVVRCPPHRSRRAVFPHRALQVNLLSHAPDERASGGESPPSADKSSFPSGKAVHYFSFPQSAAWAPGSALTVG